MADVAVVVSPSLTIPGDELVIRATRSGGPGGQHVNTSSTRIEVVWDLAGSQVISEEMRARLMIKLATRLDSAGQLRIVAQAERSQLRNREAAFAQLALLVARGLEVPKPRKKTKPTKASKERRLQGKQRRSEIKRDRRAPDHD